VFAISFYFYGANVDVALSGYELDIQARTALHQHGWDFKHVSGHGIGYFLSVSEGWCQIHFSFTFAL